MQRVEKRDSKMPFVSRVGEKFRDQDFNYFIQPRAFFIQSSCAEPTRTLYKNLLHCASVTTSETHVSLETIAIRTAFTSKVSYRGAIERRDYRSNCVKRASLGPSAISSKESTLKSANVSRNAARDLPPVPSSHRRYFQNACTNDLLDAMRPEICPDNGFQKSAIKLM